MAATTPALVQLNYEVFGKVQGKSWLLIYFIQAGVFFRKYTQKQAIKLSLVGFVRNTDRGTVEGIAQGHLLNITAFRDWLRKEGSPKSSITDAKFTQLEIDQLSTASFDIRRQ